MAYLVAASMTKKSIRHLQTEEVVGGDAELASAGNFRVLGSSAGGYDERFRRHFLLDALLVDGLDGVAIQEAGVLVQVSDL